MTLLFWSSLALIFLAYAAYPVLIYFRVLFRPRPVQRANTFPSVTILLAVHNEQLCLPAKLQNLAKLDYPADLVHVIVVSDGSTDETNKILGAWEKIDNRRTVILTNHCGKASALNHGLAEAKGEILVFTDARQAIAPDGLKSLLSNFADPTVGCVSGELITGQDRNATFSGGVGLYWLLEKKIRHWEGLAGSTVGATGAFYGARKNLLSPLPPETILDDVHIPFQVVRQGQRVIFEPKAQVSDYLKPSPKQEYRRKVRTLLGNFQLLQLDPWLLTRSNPLRLEFFCHKLLRLIVPFGLVGMLISTIWLQADIYRLVLVLQIVFYSLAALSIFHAKGGIVSRLANISLAFIVLNTAAAVAMIYFVIGKKAVWARS